MTENQVTLDFIFAYIDSMGYDQQTFCILEDDTGSYVPCLGDNHLQIVEYRNILDDDYHHYISGADNPTKKSWFRTLLDKLSTGKNPKDNEVLETTQTKQIFQHFYETNSIPDEFVLRDISKFL